jgi:hypothetical protein
MTYMLCRNRVADFAAWKRVFDSHAAAHGEAGLHLQGLWRNVDDPHEVFFLFAVDDVAKARAFVAAPDVPDAQRESGVLDRPDIYFLT